MAGNVWSALPSTRMTAGEPSLLTSHFTVEPLLASCKLEMVTLTGLSVTLFTEVLSPGVPRKWIAAVSCFEIVELTTSMAQKMTSGEVPLCLQVKVICPPAGITYPPGTWVPLAVMVATTTSAGSESSGMCLHGITCYTVLCIHLSKTDIFNPLLAASSTNTTQIVLQSSYLCIERCT